jgi:hypothetical protein
MMIMKLGEMYKVFNYQKKIKLNNNIGKFGFLDSMPLYKEKKGGMKADKHKLVNVVSLETANKSACVIL